MNESEINIKASDIFGRVETDTEMDKYEARRLRRQTAMLFRSEVDSLIKLYPDINSRKELKQTEPLEVSLEQGIFNVRAVKTTKPWIKFERKHYVTVDYKLVVQNPATEQEINLFTFEDTLYPKTDNPDEFEHGDTKIFNRHGKMASHHEALEGLWGLRILSEQLEAKAEQKRIEKSA